MSLGEVADRAHRAAADRDFETLLDLLGRQPLKIWYGIPIEQLAAIVACIPRDLARDAPDTVQMTLHFFGGCDDDTGSVAADADSMPWPHRLVAGLRARSHGDIRTADRLLAGLPAVLPGSPPHFDSTLGMRTLALGQVAFTVALAGRFREALDLYGTVLLSAPVPGLEMLTREAYVRSGLIHGIWGDPASARTHLRLASALPRTSSWVEVRLDREQQLLAAMLDDDDAGAGYDLVMDLTHQWMGEAWPFYASALHRAGVLAGQQHAVRVRLETLRSTGLGQPPGYGLTGSVLNWLLAYDAFFAGNVQTARDELAAAAPGEWQTQEVEAIIAIAASEPRRAIELCRAAAPHTRDLRMADQRRTLTLALAHFAAGEPDEAVELLRGVVGDLQLPEMRAVAMLSPRLAELAAERVPGWPRAEDAVADGVLDAPVLTASELRVLGELARGRSRSQIARALYVSPNTVKTHVSALYRKLGVGSAREAVREAGRRGML